MLDFGADPTGSSANFHTVLQNAFAEAKARQRAEIRIPSGHFKLGGTCTLISPETDGHYIRIIGCGNSTYISSTSATAHWFQIGPTGASLASATAKTYNIEFESLVFSPSVAPTDGAVFNVRNARYIKWANCQFRGMRQAFKFGCTGATLVNDSGSFIIAGCGMSNRPGVTHPMIELGSGGSLVIYGSNMPFYNAVVPREPQALIEQTSTVANWDGLWVTDLKCSDYFNYVKSTDGDGIVNMQWRGGMLDGALKPFVAVGDGNMEWMVSDGQMLNTEDQENAYPVDWNSTGHITVNNCSINGFSQYVFARAGSVYITNNSFFGSGTNYPSGTGTSLITFNAPHGLIQGNRWVPRSTHTDPIRSISWGAVGGATRLGPSSASPTSLGNAFRDLPVSGSP